MAKESPFKMCKFVAYSDSCTSIISLHTHIKAMCAWVLCREKAKGGGGGRKEITVFLLLFHILFRLHPLRAVVLTVVHVHRVTYSLACYHFVYSISLFLHSLPFLTPTPFLHRFMSVAFGVYSMQTNVKLSCMQHFVFVCTYRCIQLRSHGAKFFLLLAMCPPSYFCTSSTQHLPPYSHRFLFI